MATSDIATELADRRAKVAEANQVVREVEAQAREAANRLELGEPRVRGAAARPTRSDRQPEAQG